MNDLNERRNYPNLLFGDYHLVKFAIADCREYYCDRIKLHESRKTPILRNF